jgi:hypothetical protein
MAEQNSMLTPAHLSGERRAIASSCCGFTGEAVLTESAVSTTTRTNNGSVTFETMDGATRVIDAQGAPTSVRWCDGGRCIEVEISDWRQE